MAEFRTPEQIMRGQALECALALNPQQLATVKEVIDIAEKFMKYIREGI